MNNFTISGFVGLNPCCSGQWSRTKTPKEVTIVVSNVLILVVVENGLVRCA